MNEELQSMNDQLQLGNEQLRDEQDQSEQASDLLTEVLGSLSAAVAVVDPELRLRVWTAPAAELWGLRSEEVLGRRLQELDFGLPVELLTDALGRLLPASGAAEATSSTVPAGPEELEFDAVNRRGHTVHVRVRISTIRDGTSIAAVISMEVLDPPPAAR